MEKLEILYEDNHIIVCVKPVNVLSQADKTGDIDMLTIIKRYLKEKYNKPGDVYLGLLHRLDRPVGGVMIFAKTSKAASRISKQISGQRDFSKEYLAVVRGIPKIREGRYTDFLLKNENTNTVRVIAPGCREYGDSACKEAVLDYRTVKSVKYKNDDITLVSINLQTGRPHQIRVQFASRGTPLLGDVRYGIDKNTQIALWSRSIRMIHPTLQEVMRFEKEPPSESPWNLF